MEKYSSIKDLVVQAYKAKGELPNYEELSALVKSNFPDSKWKETHYAWYKSKIKRGKIAVGKTLEKQPVIKLPSSDPPKRTPSILNLKNLDIRSLFKLHEDIFVELIQRNIVHSSNNIIANYSEKLACDALGLKQMPESTKGYDAVDESGVKFEIKGRKPTAKNKSRQLSFIRNLDKKHFDYLVGILYEENFEVKKAAKIPYDVIKEKAVYSNGVNGWIFQLRDEIWEIPKVVDVTVQIKKAEAKYNQILNS